MARLAITSLTFMLVWVPEPVCHTDSGNSLVQVAGDDLVGDARDQLAPSQRGRRPAVGVDQRRRLLDVAEGVADGGRHAVLADGEVRQRALRLRPPQRLGRHLDGAHAVGFDADR